MRYNNQQTCFGSNSLYYNACNCFSCNRSICLFLCRNSIYPILYPIFSIVTGAFLLITILEHIYIFKRWKEHLVNVILCEISLLSGNMILMWLAFKQDPQMESMVMNVESWNDFSVRESFSGLHSQCQSLAEIGLLVTMILPWLTRISVFCP